MTKKFGTTTHAEIAHAFEAERRQHTYIEQLDDGQHIKKYELRLSLTELFTVLDHLTGPTAGSVLPARQLRAKILATLGLFEDG